MICSRIGSGTCCGLATSSGSALAVLLKGTRASELVTNRLSDGAKEFVIILIAAPFSTRRIPIVVPGSRSGGEPHLVGGGLAIQDVLATICELEGYDAVGSGEIDLIRVEALELLRDAL